MEKFKKSKSIIRRTLGIIVSAIMFAAFIPAIAFASKLNSASASTIVAVSNNSFESQTSDNTVYSPTSWTASIKESNDNDFFVGGKISTAADKFNDEYTALLNAWIASHPDLNGIATSDLPVATNPEKSASITDETDLSVLMLSSRQSVEGTNAFVLTPLATEYTFSSASISIDAFAYYEVSVLVKTTGNATAAISISGIDDAKYDSITSAEWTKYTVYFSLYESKNVKINLELNTANGKSGFVFFDDVKMNKLTYSEYISATDSLDNEEILINEHFAGMGGFSASPVNNVAVFTLSSEDNGASVALEDGRVKITNYNTSSVSFKTPSLPIRALTNYRLSFWIKSDYSNSKFTIKAIANDENSTSASVNASITDSTKGEYQEYVLYVRGNSYKNINIDLELTFTTEGSHTFDYMICEAITLDAYTNASGTKLALNTDNQSANITNGFFTEYLSHSVSSETIFPASWSYFSTGYKYMKDSTKPAELTDINISDVTNIVEKTSLTYDGKAYFYKNSSGAYEFINNDKTERIYIIENMQFTYDAEKDAIYNSAYKCIADDFEMGIENIDSDIDNVYVGNLLLAEYTGTSKAIIKSSEISIPTGYDYFISFMVGTTLDDPIIIAIEDEDTNEITSFTFVTSTGDPDVEQVKIYFRGGSETKNIKLCFYLDENSDELGIANVGKYQASTFDDINTKKLSSLENTYIVDLSDNNFKAFSYTDAANGIYKATALNVSENENVGTYGILDTLEESTYKTTYGDKIVALDNDSSTKVIIIDNAANKSTTVSLKEDYSLVASSYYTLTIYAKTLKIADGSTFTISFTGSNDNDIINSKIENINTSGLNNDKTNGYQKYIIYIATGEKAIDNLNVEMILNGEGTVLIDNIQLETSSKSALTSASENDYTVIANFTTETSTKTSKDGTEKVEEEEDKKSTGLIIFFYVFSSLVLVAAIVLALLFIISKRLPKFKKGSKVKTRKVNPRSGRGFV